MKTAAFSLVILLGWGDVFTRPQLQSARPPDQVPLAQTLAALATEIQQAGTATVSDDPVARETVERVSFDGCQLNYRKMIEPLGTLTGARGVWQQARDFKQVKYEGWEFDLADLDARSITIKRSRMRGGKERAMVYFATIGNEKVLERKLPGVMLRQSRYAAAEGVIDIYEVGRAERIADLFREAIKKCQSQGGQASGSR